MRLRAGVAIDLGTVNTLVYVAGRGLVIDEPSAIAARPDDWQRDRGGGRSGRSGWARSLQGVDVIHPLRDGVVADLTRRWPCCRRSCAGLTCAAARCGRSAVICVPGGATWVEQRSLAVAAGRSSPGATSSSSKSRSPPRRGPSSAPPTCLVRSIVDIGGGTTEVAVVTSGHLVRAQSLRLGGNAMDEAIVQAVKADLACSSAATPRGT